MAHTAAMPYGIAQYALNYNPRANATVFIQGAYVPDFGIVPNQVIPGSLVASNAFYNRNLNYSNVTPNVLLSPNMEANQYLGFIPGIMRMPIGSA